MLRRQLILLRLPGLLTLLWLSGRLVMPAMLIRRRGLAPALLLIISFHESLLVVPMGHRERAAKCRRRHTVCAATPVPAGIRAEPRNAALGRVAPLPRRYAAPLDCI